MSKHLMRISVNSKEFEELIEELGEISNQLHRCAAKVSSLCGLSIVEVEDKEEAASGN